MRLANSHARWIIAANDRVEQASRSLTVLPRVTSVLPLLPCVSPPVSIHIHSAMPLIDNNSRPISSMRQLEERDGTTDSIECGLERSLREMRNASHWRERDKQTTNQTCEEGPTIRSKTLGDRSVSRWMD